MSGMDPRHAILFEPVQVGPKTLPNRFYQVPHATGFGAVKPRTHAAFRGIKAEGGWGGVCTDYAPVSPDADETWAVASDTCLDEAAPLPGPPRGVVPKGPCLAQEGRDVDVVVADLQ